MSESIAASTLSVPISAELFEMVSHAAELQGQALDEFVVVAVQEAVCLALQQIEVVRLSAADQLRFASALLVPGEPSPALVEALSRRRALLRED
jgi:uncharacterized protein (DUF1778 family)